LLVGVAVAVDVDSSLDLVALLVVGEPLRGDRTADGARRHRDGEVLQDVVAGRSLLANRSVAGRDFRRESEPSAVVLAGLIAVEDALVEVSDEAVDHRAGARRGVVVVHSHSGGVVANTNSPVRLRDNVRVEGVDTIVDQVDAVSRDLHIKEIALFVGVVVGVVRKSRVAYAQSLLTSSVCVSKVRAILSIAVDPFKNFQKRSWQRQNRSLRSG